MNAIFYSNNYAQMYQYIFVNTKYYIVYRMQLDENKIYRMRH